ncbi:hypothetical protein BGZ76_011002 [Entomortierella beljakovae]|nr:hypothetical protein BGZ76_011002 [Entomortierella beljakovae]
MSSYKPATYNNTTSSENSDNNQHSFQQDSLPQRDVFEPHDSRGSPHMPVAGKKAILARIEGEDDELVVIGTGINPYEPLDPKRRPIKLPNIDYGYPEASVQNFSPGTSVIFNAFKGHTSLLRRPYMASNEDSERLIEDAAHRRPQSPYSQESHFEQPPRQHSIYSSREKDSSSSYRQQHPLEHSPYRASHDRQFHPYQPNSHPRDHSDYRDYQERRGSKEYNDSREFDDPMNRHGQRSPRMSYSATNQGVSNPSQSWTERSFDHQSKMSEHHDPYRHRDDYPSQATSYSRRSPPPPPPQHKSHDPGRHMPPPSLSTIQNRRTGKVQWITTPQFPLQQ